MNAQRIRKSEAKPGRRSVEDFTELEQWTAYFNGDPIRVFKKGMNILDRIQVSKYGSIAIQARFPAVPEIESRRPLLDVGGYSRIFQPGP
jgi:hypothetical protein